MDVQQADTQGKQVGQVMHTCFIQLGSYTGDGARGVGGGGVDRSNTSVFWHMLSFRQTVLNTTVTISIKGGRGGGGGGGVCEGRTQHLTY